MLEEVVEVVFTCLPPALLSILADLSWIQSTFSSDSGSGGPTGRRSRRNRAQGNESEHGCARSAAERRNARIAPFAPGVHKLLPGGLWLGLHRGAKSQILATSQTPFRPLQVEPPIVEQAGPPSSPPPLSPAPAWFSSSCINQCFLVDKYGAHSSGARQADSSAPSFPPYSDAVAGTPVQLLPHCRCAPFFPQLSISRIEL